jgi:hypothetical protein
MNDDRVRDLDSDRSARFLDDHADKAELRERHYGLLQELRVLLPGVQVIVAFLLTAPFAARFGELDDLENALYGFALTAGLLSVVAFVAPTALHRVGHRTARAERLETSIRLVRAGLVLLALTLVSGLYLVARFVFDGATAVVLAGVLTAAMVWLWVYLPFSATRHHADV